jgi:hypothetical protein
VARVTRGGLIEWHRTWHERGGIRVELLSLPCHVKCRVGAQVGFGSWGAQVGLTGHLGSSRVMPLAYLSGIG